MDTKGKGGMWDEVGDWDWHVSPLILCIKWVTGENLWSSTEYYYSVLCGDQNEKEIQERGDTYKYVADSLCCTAGTNMKM